MIENLYLKRKKEKEDQLNFVRDDFITIVPVEQEENFELHVNINEMQAIYQVSNERMTVRRRPKPERYSLFVF